MREASLDGRPQIERASWWVESEQLETAGPAGRWRWGGAGLLVAAIAAGAVLVGGGDAAQSDPWAARPGPWADARRVLDAHAAALLDGDEAGWLAAVDRGDPELDRRYGLLFANLRALDVSSWRYRPAAAPTVLPDGRITVDLDVVYCFRSGRCPRWQPAVTPDPVPRLSRRVTLRRTDGGYRIAADAGVRGGPRPWESTPLTVRHGERATVAVPAGAPVDPAYLDAMLRAADRAAGPADRLAARLGTAIPRYRVFLADESDWAAWFGGGPADGDTFTASNGSTALDVVHRLDGADPEGQLRREFGRVAALSNRAPAAGHEWLVEGVARRFTTGPARSEDAPTGALPGSIVLAGTDPELAGRAVDCLVDRAGEQAVLTFALQVLRYRRGYDDASRSAFGTPFATVDAACTARLAAP
jgi:hypothetical protein